MDENQKITIFTDGAARGNPGQGGWAAVIVLPQNNDGGKTQNTEPKNQKVVELGGREEHTTNNRMELTAAIEALSLIRSLKLKANSLQLVIYSDSSYLLNGITKWIHGWQKNGWQTTGKKEVENRDLWETLADLTRNYAEQTRNKIEWKYVSGHIGIAGNHRCDEIATAFADGKNPNLYHGPLAGYPIKNILDISFDEQKEKQRSDSRFRSRAKAYSYVSMVDGVIQTHKTWGLCEQRVKGKSGARFKKATSAEEEKETIKSWIV